MLAFRVASIGVLSGHRCLQSPADTAASRKISWKALPCTTVDPSNMSSRAHFNWPLPRKGPPQLTGTVSVSLGNPGKFLYPVWL